MRITFIDADQALTLRQRILRPGQTLASAAYTIDTQPATFHVGAWLENRLVGVATFFPQAHTDFSTQKPYQLRGMATDTVFQARGLGKAVLNFGTEEILRREGDFVWCNARESAFGFYLKLGLQLHGAFFDIPGIGPHKVMYKYLALR